MILNYIWFLISSLFNALRLRRKVHLLSYETFKIISKHPLKRCSDEQLSYILTLCFEIKLLFALRDSGLNPTVSARKLYASMYGLKSQQKGVNNSVWIKSLISRLKRDNDLELIAIVNALTTERKTLHLDYLEPILIQLRSVALEDLITLKTKEFNRVLNPN